MLALKKKRQSLKTMLLDPGLPLDHRKQMLIHLVMDESPESEKLLESLLQDLAAGNGKSVYTKKIKELEEGPLRIGTSFSGCRFSPAM